MNLRLLARFSVAFPSLLAACAVSMASLSGSLGAAEVNATFSSPTSVPASAASYTATGNTVNFSLNFAPPVGTNLTVVDNTGLAFIQGRFDNLAQGQRVSLTYDGISYPFVANYYGGSGNDLTLDWANKRLLAWGYNHCGQLGTGNAVQSNVPVAVDLSGIESGKVIAGIAVGWNHSLLRFTDGTLAAWGDNASGQLGDNSTIQRTTPGAVDVSLLDADSRFMMMVASGSAANHNLTVVALPELDAATALAWLQGNEVGNGLSGDDLIRYAFGFAAGDGISVHLPQPQRVGDQLVIRFVQPAGVTDVSYGAEWSETLAAGSWQALPDTGTGGDHVFGLPVGTAPSLFMRLKVSR